MPIYDYVCTICGQRAEVMHAVHAPGPEACAACGGSMRKALSLPAIVFKGSGWAKKDARSASRSSSAKGDKDSAGSERKDSAADKAGSAEGGTGSVKEATASTSD